MAGSLVRVDTVERVRVLTLNRPDVLNAMSIAVITELDALLAEAEADAGIGCVVLTGAGDTAFSAGVDIHELVAAAPDAQTVMALHRKEATWHWANAAVPTVAAVNGLCYGNGTILAVCSDLRVGGPQTRIKVTAVSYGGANLTWVLPELIGVSHAKDMLLTGRVVDGPEAYRIGLLNRYADDGDVIGAALQLAASIAALPASGPRTIKRLVQDGPGRDLQARFEKEQGLEVAGIVARQTDGVFDGFLARARKDDAP